MSKVRMNIELSDDVAKFLNDLACKEGATKTELIRRALSVLKAYEQQKDLGRDHMGFTSKPENLEAEMLGILDS